MKIVRIKPSATALNEKVNEVTVTIMNPDKNLNYHETFYADTTKHQSFTFNGKTYDMPPKDTLHYEPSFWRFDVKLASFFDRHKTWAQYLDWFKLRKKAIFEVGYLYWENTPDPLDIETENRTAKISAKHPELNTDMDWAYAHYLLEKQSIVHTWYKDFSTKLRGKGEGFQNWWILLAIVAGIVVVGIIMIYQGNLSPAQQAVQNVTGPSVVPFNPAPTPFVLK